MNPEPADEMRNYVGRGLLDDRRALVTGGDSGIGRALAVAFAKEGADLAFTYVSEHEDTDARHTAELVQAADRRSLPIRGELAEEDICQQTVRRPLDER
jgi:NAD(P)-dependent dehydrogenase (short-subunit alcohol dehydrogenase family)